jgi:hypothetical protein
LFYAGEEKSGYFVLLLVTNLEEVGAELCSQPAMPEAIKFAKLEPSHNWQWPIRDEETAMTSFQLTGR